MYWKAVLCFGFLPIVSGCNIAYYTARNAVNEPALQINQLKFRHRLRSEARAILDEIASSCPTGTFSAAYEDGFVDGYSDQVINGGKPIPPAAPPARYRRHVDDFTAAGQTDQRNYLAGFQHGAETAASMGRRQITLVELAVPAPAPELPLNIQCVPAPPEASLGATLPSSPLPTVLPDSTSPPAALPPPNPVIPALPNQTGIVPEKPTLVGPQPQVFQAIEPMTSIGNWSCADPFGWLFTEVQLPSKPVLDNEVPKSDPTVIQTSLKRNVIRKPTSSQK